ncbi:uncharacterized protein LOC143240193 isoform X4 [Tachypleus tridentatus]|uniref:uncharacterized protein LOC143240193 isoform X4 n=1 Tax=Tachypleus tridentatus TaxID=6853 RepID=UPI003FD1BA4B
MGARFLICSKHFRGSSLQSMFFPNSNAVTVCEEKPELKIQEIGRENQCAVLCVDKPGRRIINYDFMGAHNSSF